MGEAQSRQPVATPAAQPLEAELDRIAALGLDEVRALWREMTQRNAPKALSRELLARMIAYRVQEQRLGKHGRETRKLLDRLAKGGAEPVRHLKVGTVVVREHPGTLHEVGTAVAAARSLIIRIKSTCPASERSAGLFGGETSTPVNLGYWLATECVKKWLQMSTWPPPSRTSRKRLCEVLAKMLAPAEFYLSTKKPFAAGGCRSWQPKPRRWRPTLGQPRTGRSNEA